MMEYLAKFGKGGVKIGHTGSRGGWNAQNLNVWSQARDTSTVKNVIYIRPQLLRSLSLSPSLPSAGRV